MNKNVLGILVFVFFLSSCGGQQGDHTKAPLPKASAKQQVAVFAGGCFWSIQEAFSELKGVEVATSGYAGGTTVNPTYEQVCSEQTGHAESVQVIYDPSVISFAQLTAAFFAMHDPSQLNRQGPDVGSSYRSVAFYSNEQEKKEIENQILRYNLAHLPDQQVVTEVKPLTKFYPAENYHQNYFRLHPNEVYVSNVCGPKVQKLRAAMPHLLKEEFR